MPVVSTVRSTPCAAATVPIASMPGVQLIGSTVMVETVDRRRLHAGEELGDRLVAEKVEADDAADDDHEQNEGDDEALDQETVPCDALRLLATGLSDAPISLSSNTFRLFTVPSGR